MHARAIMAQVFGATALALADLRVLKDPAFRSVSVTAERWVPLEQVPERTLLPWLAQKRAQGYRHVACASPRCAPFSSCGSCMGLAWGCMSRCPSAPCPGWPRSARRATGTRCPACLRLDPEP